MGTMETPQGAFEEISMHHMECKNVHTEQCVYHNADAGPLTHWIVGDVAIILKV